MSRQPEVRVTVAARTDRGRTRDHNEDTYLVGDLTRGTTELIGAEPTVVGPRGTLFLVADGMGGAAAGELASAMAADAIFQHLRATWTAAADDSGDEFIRHLRDAVELANQRIHAYATEHPDARGMGTTATVVGVLGTRLYLAQVGDSRAYLIRRDRAVQLTKDQSLMQRLIDAGELTEEQAAQSERRNIILQALGPDPRIRADVTYQDLARGDTLILCSDGLSGQVKRDEIGAAVAAVDRFAELPDRLIAMANERGGPDNITVVAARFDGPGLADGAAPDDLGYHAYPLDEPEPPPAPPAPPAPAADVPVDPAPVPDLPTPRAGLPIHVGVVGIAVLIALFALYLLLT